MAGPVAAGVGESTPFGEDLLPFPSAVLGLDDQPHAHLHTEVGLYGLLVSWKWCEEPEGCALLMGMHCYFHSDDIIFLMSSHLY